MLFLSKEGEILNSDSNNPYYQKVKNLVDGWYNGIQEFSFSSSGSSGSPKILKFNREQIICSVNTTKQAFELTSNCLFFCNMHVDFVAGSMMVFRALVLEADLLVLEPSANPLLNLGRQELLISKYRRRVFFAFAPLQMEAILKDTNSKDLLFNAKHVLLGGAPVSKELENKLIESNLSIYEGYGMTETLSHVALRELDDKPQEFKILPGIEFRISEDGCLELNYPGVLESWLKTNDLAKKTSKNKFLILGRADNVINSGGVKLHLNDIEEKIRVAGIVKQRFFCAGIEDNKYGQKLVICIENKEKYLEIADFKSFLSKFEVPKELIFLEKFILTPTLKINKRETIDGFLRNKISNL